MESWSYEISSRVSLHHFIRAGLIKERYKCKNLSIRNSDDNSNNRYIHVYIVVFLVFFRNNTTLLLLASDVISLYNQFFLFFSQSTPTSYEHFTREVLTAGETTRQRSIQLRSNLNDIYTNSIKDLHDQAIRVDIALAENVKLTQDCLQQLETELHRVSSANATKDRTYKR